MSSELGKAIKDPVFLECMQKVLDSTKNHTTCNEYVYKFRTAFSEIGYNCDFSHSVKSAFASVKEPAHTVVVITKKPT